MTTLLVLQVWFFQWVRFLGSLVSQVQGPFLGPVFGRYQINQLIEHPQPIHANHVQIRSRAFELFIF